MKQPTTVPSTYPAFVDLETVAVIVLPHVIEVRLRLVEGETLDERRERPWRATVEAVTAAGATVVWFDIGEWPNRVGPVPDDVVTRARAAHDALLGAVTAYWDSARPQAEWHPPGPR